MNILDIVVLILLVFYALNGAYRGFSGSLLNLGGIYSVVAAVLLDVSAAFGSAFRRCHARLAEVLYRRSGKGRRRGVGPHGDKSALRRSDTEYGQLCCAAAAVCYSDTFKYKRKSVCIQGVESLGDYFNLTIFNVTINIISVLIIFVVLRIIFTLLTNAFSYAAKLPTLRRRDTLTGGLIGFVRGFLAMYMVFMVVPVMLIMINISEITAMMNSSVTCGIFYSGSVVLGLISGVA